jgi:mRNA interferase RelE/StbE
MPYQIRFTREAHEMFDDLGDNRTKRIVRDRIAELADEPDKMGKPLTGPLKGYRSIRVGGRHRVIYRIESQVVTVLIVAVGARKEGDKRDVYAWAQRLVRMDLIE